MLSVSFVATCQVALLAIAVAMDVYFPFMLKAAGSMSIMLFYWGLLRAYSTSMYSLRMVSLMTAFVCILLSAVLKMRFINAMGSLGVALESPTSLLGLFQFQVLFAAIICCFVICGCFIRMSFKTLGHIMDSGLVDKVAIRPHVQQEIQQ